LNLTRNRFRLATWESGRQEIARSEPSSDRITGAELVTVTIRLFAVARQRVGAPEIRVTLADPATVGDLRRATAEQYPELASLLPAMMVAVENEYVGDDVAVAEGHEIALIPPVSGGSIAFATPPGGRNDRAFNFGFLPLTSRLNPRPRRNDP
jgi:molybdopterin converting factor subunit 1